jgi:hypothetical protein
MSASHCATFFSCVSCPCILFLTLSRPQYHALMLGVARVVRFLFALCPLPYPDRLTANCGVAKLDGYAVRLFHQPF